MKLALIYTGGTIGGRSEAVGPVRREHGLAAFLAILEKRLPARVRPFELEATAVRPALSENRTPADWPVLARAVDRAVRGGVSGVVVAHGTDTMLHGACLVSELLKGIPAPVVFTGSNRPLDESDTDAAQNLGHAFRVARAAGAAGVWISYAGTAQGPSVVLDPKRARKEAFRSDCFQPLWGPAAGRVTGVAERGERLRLSGMAGRRADCPYAPRFGIRRAVLFWLYPGFEPALIRRAVAQGVRGIVLAAYGSGTACMAPGGYDVRPAVRAGVRAGVRVAVVSQHAGRVRPAYGSTAELVRAGAELLPETTPEAALAMLMASSSAREPY